MTELSPSTARSARLLRYATQAGIALLGLAILLALWVLLTGRMEILGAAVRVEGEGLPPRAAAGAVALLAVMLILALRRLVRMLRIVEAGRPFGTAGELHGFAGWLFLTVLAAVLLPPLIHLALGAERGGAHMATFSMSGDQALMLLVTGLLFLVARLLDEAQRLADDHEQIV
jgi:hypothetical protein